MLTGAARGDILYQDLHGLPVTTNYNDVSLDMDLDGINEVFARYYAECDIFPIHEYAAVYFGTAVDRAFIADYASGYARGLGPAESIGTNFIYKATGSLLYGQDEQCDAKYTYSNGDWRGITSKYLPIRIASADGIHYGWVRVENQTGSHDSFRVMECAMETQKGVPIFSGDTGGCPAIRTQPVESHVVEDHTLEFSVVATGFVKTYQWYKDGVPLTDDSRVSGSQTRRLSIRSASAADVGRYSVDASGPCGTASSNEVSAWVDPDCRPVPGWEMGVNGGVAVVPDSPDLRPTTALTVELWFNPAKNNTNPVLASKGGRDWCSNHSWAIEYDGAAIFPLPFCLPQVTFINGPGCRYAYLVTATGAPNQWTHIAMTVDTVAGVMRSFVNGQEINSTTVTSDGKPFKGLSIAPTNWPMSVGRVTQNGLPVAEPFFGRVDEVRVWNVVRTPAQIAASYAETLSGNELGLAAAYSFDDPGAPGIDGTGRGNNASLLPGTYISETLTCCPADFDRSGFADTDDFTAFVTAFNAGDPTSDFDRSGYVDTDDFTAYVNAFNAGC